MPFFLDEFWSVTDGALCGQWEFQVGPTVGVSAGDERYILEVKLPLSFVPQFKSDVNHTTFCCC
jgi:hypothetical protein